MPFLAHAGCQAVAVQASGMSENEQLSHTHGNAVTREAVATPMAMRPARFTSAEYLRPPARPRRLQTSTSHSCAWVILATVTLSSAMCGAGGDGAAPCRGRLLTRAHTLGLRGGDGGGKRGALPRGARVHSGEASKIERFPARALICVLPQGTQLANGAHADAPMHGARARALLLSRSLPHSHADAHKHRTPARLHMRRARTAIQSRTVPGCKPLVVRKLHPRPFDG